MGVWRWTDVVDDLVAEAKKPTLSAHSFVHDLTPGKYLVVRKARDCEVIFRIRATHRTEHAIAVAKARAFKPLYVVNVRDRA